MTSKKIEVCCTNCNKKLLLYPSRITSENVFCNKKCMGEYSKKYNEIIVKETFAEIVIKSKKYGKHIVLIDVEDVDKCKKYNWTLRKDKFTFYAQHSTKTKTILLHRYLMDFPDNLYIDHINHNGLDNRKNNLSIVTNSENQQNRNGVKGIRKQYNKWKPLFK